MRSARATVAPSGIPLAMPRSPGDRKSTRLNSSHLVISYAVFCLKKKVNRTRIHAKHLRVLPPQHRARDLSERVRRGLRGAVRRENRKADERGHRVEVGDGAAAILREYWREGLRDRKGAEEVHFHLLSPALDPLRISEFATGEADDARVVDQEIHVRRSRGGGRDLRRVGHIELERHDAGAVAVHERTEGRDAAGGGVHLSYARRDERAHDGFADATVGAGDGCGLARE